MKRIYSLIIVLMAMQMVFADIHTFKVTSANEDGPGSLSDIVTQVNSIPESDEAVITFDVKDTIHAENTQFVINRILSIKGGLNNVLIKSEGFSCPDTILREVSNVKFIGNGGGNAFLLRDSVEKIVNCSFFNYDVGILASSYDLSIDLVQNCEFIDVSNGIVAYGKVNVVNQCKFKNSEKGLVFYNTSPMEEISDCVFENCSSNVRLYSPLSIQKISGCVSDGGIFDIKSSELALFTNNNLMGTVEFHSKKVNKIFNCQFGSNVEMYSVSIDSISQITMMGELNLYSGNISLIENSKFYSSITGNSSTINKMIKDTISNPNGDGIVSANISLIDSCLVSQCVNGFLQANIDTLESTEISFCSKNGIYDTGVKLISKCDIHNNKSDGLCTIMSIGTIENSSIYGNGGIGIYVKDLDNILDCDIFNNNGGIYSSNGLVGNIKNTRILNNKINGIHASTSTIDTISQCYISGSETALFLTRVVSVICNNVIGVDGEDLSLNGNDIGVFVDGMSSIIIENNVISGNKNCAIYAKDKPSLTVKNNYIGTNFNGDVLGNKIGLKIETMGAYLIENIIAHNEYGLIMSCRPYTLTSNIFKSNRICGIQFSDGNSGNFPDIKSNKFFSDLKSFKAIDLSLIDTFKVIPTPMITSVSLPDEYGYVVVSGVVEVDYKVNVSIFESNGKNQNVLEYLSSDSTDNEGNFRVRVKIPNSVELSFIAQADALHKDKNSEFSDTYILPPLDRKEYYVKTQKEGKGDGSSWENAMDGKDFAFVLPQVGDGVTFYVAEGEYDLKKLSTSTDGTPTVYINSPVTIIGGYPANAEEGAVSSPATHHTWMKTGYFRLATGGDVIFDGLRFESTYTWGVFDSYSYGKPNLKVTLKNSVAIGGKEGGNNNTVYACGERLILENDTIYGTYSEYDCVFVQGGCSLDAKNTVMVDAKRSGVYSQASNVSLDSCVISGNKECGIYTINGNVLSLKNCIVGLSTDARSKKGNGVGINSSSAYVFLENNVIAGNEKEGIKITNGNTRIELLAGNYIGTNKDFENLGNGLDGLYLGGGTVTFPSTLDSANYIGFNGKNGIYTNGRASLNISCNYIGITAAGNLMPNEEYGVYFYSNATSNTFKNVFGYNKQGALFFTNFGTFPQFISENLFFGTEGNAIDLGGDMRNIFTPRISKIERVLDSIYIEGTTDTTFVSDIELFYTNGELQTAHKFLGRKSTTKQGEFSFVIPVETLPKNGNVCFSATATYNGQTGELTDPFCCDSCLCPTDTTLATDTLIAGVPFVDGVVYSVGRHDSIIETITLPNGCDSVVMHTLVVKPNPEVKEYYVKTSRQGTGDGSTWENAMDSIDFATYLPLAPDGATFYVAEGVYRPVYDAGLFVPKNSSSKCYTINSSVTIRGGYPADAETGAVSEPKKYLTVFDGDILGDDVIDESIDTEGFISVDRTNTEDNSDIMFSYFRQDELNFTMDGVVIKNTSIALDIDVLNKGKSVITLLNDSFVYNGYNGNVGLYVVNVPYGDGIINVDECSFEKNRGCINSSLDLNITNSLFNNNGDKNYGILFNRSGGNEHNVLVQNSIFNKNASSSFIILCDNLSIIKCQFRDNKALEIFRVEGSANGIIDSSAFVGNVVSLSIVFPHFIEDKGGEFLIKRSLFSNNTSSESILFSVGTNMEIDSCEFNSNVTGGNLINSQNTGQELFYLTNSVIQDNKLGNELSYLVCSEDVRCVCFKKNIVEENQGLLLNLRVADSIFVEENLFSDNKSSSNQYAMVLNGNAGDTFLNFNNNTIDKNYLNGSLIQLPSSFGNGIQIFNNTIVSNHVEGVILEFNGSGGFQIVNNNTIVGNSCHSALIDQYGARIDFKGNIILGNSCVYNEKIVELIHGNYSSFGVIKDNIFPAMYIYYGTSTSTNCDSVILADNIVSVFNKEDFPCEEFNVENRNEEILTSLFEGTYNPETNLFTPVLAYNGGFTPTVALKSDKLPDGKSIRFPLSETTVTTDQRGVERLEQTCMGAYELVCSPIEVEVADTVVVGDEYLFNDVDLSDLTSKVGVHSFTDTLRAVSGCDSIIHLSLAVRPVKKEGGYYVKKKGIGDGSDWENAMSPEYFSRYLPLAYDGDTFHIAEGTYKSLTENKRYGRSYVFSSSVTLIGGYPDTASFIGTSPNPSLYETRLSADVRNNDIFSFYPHSLDISSSYQTGENDSFLIATDGIHQLTLFGLTLSGVNNCAGAAINLGSSSLKMERCVVEKNMASAISCLGGDVEVYDSRFYQNFAASGSVFSMEGGSLQVVRSTMDENMTEESCGGKSVASVAMLKGTKVRFENSTMATNASKDGSILVLDDVELDLINNTISGNLPIDPEADGHLFSSYGNSKIDLFANLVVGNKGLAHQGTANITRSEYNIFMKEAGWNNSATDMTLEFSELETVLDGTANPNSFVPRVRDNAGFTPTIAVISSGFSGGQILSVPRTSREVETDQRGFIRKDTSCVGAFEFPTLMHYYVKQQSSGDGTGRSWDNAMGDTTFARYFSIVPPAATFYVAQGRYVPMYDYAAKFTKSYYNSFSTNRCLNIIGAYPPNAQKGAMPDPIKYKTILTADYANDDEVVYDEDKYDFVTINNRKDNGYYIMQFQPRMDGEINLSGIVFEGNRSVPKGSSSALSIWKGKEDVRINLFVDSCRFVNDYCGMSVTADTIEVNACQFDNNSFVGASFTHNWSKGIAKQIIVENSSFDGMSKAMYFIVDSGAVMVRNNTINRVMEPFAIYPQYGYTPSSVEVSFVNNTISSIGSHATFYMPNYVPTTFIGNIFNTNIFMMKDPNYEHEAVSMKSDYNLFIAKPDTLYDSWNMGEHDLLVSSESLQGVLDGEYKSDFFRSHSTYPSDTLMTKVVVLKNDYISDSITIRFPLSETTVTTDQRGEARLPFTSMGAYELADKERDTILIQFNDTVCWKEFHHYEEWNISTDTLAPGVYEMERFKKGNMFTDTTFHFTLTIRPYEPIVVNEVIAIYPICAGGDDGEIRSVYGTIDNDPVNFRLKDSFGVEIYNEISGYAKAEGLRAGRYQVELSSSAACVVDTTFFIEVLDREPLSISGSSLLVDSIFTPCRTNSSASYEMPIIGYHPSMEFRLDGNKFSSENINPLAFISYTDEYNYTDAFLHLTQIPVGNHSLTVSDACGLDEEIKQIVVYGPDEMKMTLLYHSKDSLLCHDSKDSVFISVSLDDYATFTLKSDNGYSRQVNMVPGDTVLQFYDLRGGSYVARLQSDIEGCTDNILLQFDVRAPQPLEVEMMVNGYACQDAVVEVSAIGESGKFLYEWTLPDGSKVLNKDVLKNVGAGYYTCKVTDSNNCTSKSVFGEVSSKLSLSQLTFNGFVQHETCFGSNNSSLKVSFGSNNEKQAVTCRLMDLDGKTVQVATSNKEYDKLIFEKVVPGTYVYNLYYGTADCRLDMNDYTDTIVINKKERPLIINKPKVTPQTCISSPDGIVEIEVSGWESGYKAYWDGVRVYPKTDFYEDVVFVINKVGGGDYSFEVKDDCAEADAIVHVSLPVYEPYKLEVTDVSPKLRCAKEQSGWVSVQLSGGIPSLGELVWNNEEKMAIPVDSIYKFENLGKGIYLIGYQSISPNCPNDNSQRRVRIDAPDTLSIDFGVSGIGCAGGTLYAEVKGETSPYRYIWSDGVKNDTTVLEYAPSDYVTESGKRYTLTVQDMAGCGELTESVEIPSLENLPPLALNVVPSTEKCYQANNGSMVIYWASGKELPIAMDVTIDLFDADGVSLAKFSRPLKYRDAIALPDTFAPGNYHIDVRYGALDCEMGLEPVGYDVTIDALRPLALDSNIFVTHKTCTKNNGTVSFTVDGWNDSHSVWVYNTRLFPFFLQKLNSTPEVNGQIAKFDMEGMSSAIYYVIVKDICNNVVADRFEIQKLLTGISDEKSNSLTCLSVPNGSLSFNVAGWTDEHQLKISNGDLIASPITNDTIVNESGQTVLSFVADSLSTGTWQVEVFNECGELADSKSILVDGINDYELKLDSENSKTKLDCPYSLDGKITLAAVGGLENSILTSWYTEHVPYTKYRFDTLNVAQIDSSWNYFPKYDSTRYSISYDTVVSGRDTIITEEIVYEQMFDSVVGYLYDSLMVYDTTIVESIVKVEYETDTTISALIDKDVVSDAYRKVIDPCTKNSYHFVYKSPLEGCPDSTYLEVSIDKPAYVKLFGQTMDVSCTSSDDGVISIKPLRGRSSIAEYSPFVVVSHDSSDAYNVNRLFMYEEDSTQLKISEFGQYRIDEFSDNHDFKSATWSHLPLNGNEWKDLSLVMPDKSDSTEQFFLDVNGDTIHSPVYSNYHLEDFWVDFRGVYQRSNTQTIANLAPGKYAVQVTDLNSCVYHDTFSIHLPPNALAIDSIVFDKDLAYCDPTKRQILVYASGGWGEYNFSFKDTLPEVSKGQLTDGYRGGEASYYDEKAQNGWGLSKFLTPGRYIATVMDKKGCMVISKDEYDVTSKFLLKADTTSVICPNDPLTNTQIYFVGDGQNSSDLNYTILEYTTPCKIGVLDDCVEMSFDTLIPSIMPNRSNEEKWQFSDIMLSTKTHGLFVYEQNNDGCGTYVEATVIDTIPAISLSKKSIVAPSCDNTKDGLIELYVQGGTPPYTIVQNSGWAVNDTLNTFESPLSQEKFEYMKDSFITYNYMTISGLSADTFFFTAIDKNQCRSVMGDTSSLDTAIVVKSPAPLSVQFMTSSICAEENSVSEVSSGALYFNRPKGGTPPYQYSYSFADNLDEEFVFSEAPIEVSGTKDTRFRLLLSDKNGCSMDTIMKFQPYGVDVDENSIVFWATTWRYRADIIALIDLCAPDSELDSVTYTFSDDRVELLDKRMYIYDIENGLDRYKEPLYGIDTKALVPDSYFENHFNLLVDESLAKHINFARVNDTVSTAVGPEQPWLEHTAFMTAYFKGCKYYSDTLALKVAYDNIVLYDGGIERKGEILNLKVSPNPFDNVDKFDDVEVIATFGSIMDAEIYLYHMDGKSSASYKIKANDNRWFIDGNEAVFKVKLSEFSGLADWSDATGNKLIPEVMILLLKTAHDAEGTHIIYRPN